MYKEKNQNVSKSEKCCICTNIITGFGHNADPLGEGRCCDSCGELVLIERISQIQNLN